MYVSTVGPTGKTVHVKLSQDALSNRIYTGVAETES